MIYELLSFDWDLMVGFLMAGPLLAFYYMLYTLFLSLLAPYSSCVLQKPLNIVHMPPSLHYYYRGCKLSSQSFIVYDQLTN